MMRPMTNHTASNPPAPVRHHPMEIAPETWVIQATHGEGVAPQVVHMNSMVIRGAEPTVVDTGAPVHREHYLEDLFSLVEPEDVRWVFISHDDADHFGNAAAVMDACPNATLVATWFLCERLAVEGFPVPPTRWRWIADGESFDAGDRTLHAIRPPLYDSPTTRGLYDDKTGVYWASDCYATPVERGTAFVGELDPQAWAAGFQAFQAWNSPWAAMLESDAFAVTCRRIEQLRPTTIATCHGPTIEATHVQQAFDLLRAVPHTPVPPQPGQPVLDEIVASIEAAMTGATA
jgi:flavorubredoxin